MSAAVTITVCTRNRAALLRDCLASLRAQRLPADQYRILVVDNGSTDDTPAVVAAAAAGDPAIASVHEPQVGISHARNRALAECGTPLIAFIDDDATAAPDWIERLIAPFRTGPAALLAVGGEIDPLWEAPRPDWLSDPFLRMYSCRLGLGDRARPIRDGEWIFEGNCVVSVDRLRALGGFPTHLGRAGTSLLSYEYVVLEIGRQRGGIIVFEPSARIVHRIHADRLNIRWLRRRAFWQGVSRARANHDFRALGLTPPRWEPMLPASRDAWNALLGTSMTAARLGADLKATESLGYMCERIGLLDP